MFSKKVVVGIMIFSIALVSISLISAGWFSDLFTFGDDEDLEGELAASHDVSVSLSNVAPTIVKFIAVFEDENGDDVDDNAGTSAGTILGDPGGTEGDSSMTARFKFTVEDLDGVTDLPGGGGATTLDEGVNVIVMFDDSVNLNKGRTASAGAGTCSASSCVGNSDCNDQTVGTNELLYICDMIMLYFDTPSPNGGAVADDRWTISVQVYDSTAVNNDQEQSGNAGFNVLDNDYIIYNVIQAVSVPATTITWSTLDINTPYHPSDAGSDLTLENGGNIRIDDEGVTAQDLVEDGIPANTLMATAFSSSDTDGVDGASIGSCDADGVGGGIAQELSSGTQEVVTVQVPYTAIGIGDTATMYYCIWPVVNPTYLGGNPVTSYVANAANTNQWAITFNSGTII